MPGLDASDFVTFLRLTDRSEMEIAIRTGQFIAHNQNWINEWTAIVEATEPGEPREMARCTYGRSIERRRKFIERLKMPDPWASWPYYEDDGLHDCAAYVAYGYWQGFFADPAARFPLARRQWDGAGIAASIEAFGFPVLRERMAIWSMANFWHLVRHDFCGHAMPDHFHEMLDILSDDWWNANLRGIAWGGGCGKPGSMQEQRLYAIRTSGRSWHDACDQVYSDRVLGRMIADCLAKRERRHHTIGYAHRVRETGSGAGGARV